MSFASEITRIGFREELQRLADLEPRITIKEEKFSDMNSTIYVDGGSEHAYYAHAVFGEERAPISSWKGNVTLTHATDDYYELFDLRQLPYADFFDGKKQAQLVILGLKAHMANGFRIPPEATNHR